MTCCSFPEVKNSHALFLLTVSRLLHPHNFQILSGQLIAPNLPDMAEKALMKSKMNSYGKTWRVWNFAPFGKPGNQLPLGESDWNGRSIGKVKNYRDLSSSEINDSM